MLRRGTRRRPPSHGFAAQRTESGQSSSGAFSDAGSSSSVRVFAAGFAFVAVARFLGFFGASATARDSSFPASPVASVLVGSAFRPALASFFSYSSTKRNGLAPERPR